jgi:N-acetylglucosaminyldiphosphoundecaprenol N-acetyl-beta-D-mannosaminyltransferase
MLSTVTKQPWLPIGRLASRIAWPTKYDLFGVRVAASDYEEIVDIVSKVARERTGAIVSLHAVHAIIESIRDPELLAKVNRFDAVLPDGQPVRWALNQLHGVGLRDRVYGPELTLRLCARAAKEGIPIYLYGSSPDVIELLQQKLMEKFSGLKIAGAESPPFRALTPEEDEAVVRRINESGAGILFVGLGCPKQDHFAADHADRIHAVQVCVGAAFDFHAGTKPMAPAWMQRHGLEWVYRLSREPRRLGRRYLQTNTSFLAKWSKQICRRVGNHSAKLITPLIGRVVNALHLTRYFEILVAYLNIVIGKGAGTGWDGGEIDLAVSLIQSAEPVVVDVGGNKGTWTRDVQKGVGAKGRWLIVEPAEEACAAIRELRLPNTELINSALSAQAGVMTLYTPGNCSGIASLHIRCDTISQNLNFEERTVPVMTLDALIESRGIACIDYLKMDTEGHELWILQGARMLLQAGRIKVLTFEFGAGNVNSRTYFRDFWDLLSQYGYAIWRITPGGTRVRIKRYYEDLEMFRGVSNYLAICSR